MSSDILEFTHPAAAPTNVASAFEFMLVFFVCFFQNNRNKNQFSLEF
jgi:hypothetical protein